VFCRNARIQRELNASGRSSLIKSFRALKPPSMEDFVVPSPTQAPSSARDLGMQRVQCSQATTEELAIESLYLLCF
jgi:hypothetical protein